MNKKQAKFLLDIYLEGDSFCPKNATQRKIVETLVQDRSLGRHTDTGTYFV